MDHLSKQQLVLLALLVSFMTSLATGIVTVSLMDQAPQGVTRTISQVIEKTIQEAAPQQDAAVGTVTLSVDDQLATAVAKVSSSIVKIEDNSKAILGLGIIVSKNGVIMVDKSVVSQSSGYSNVAYSVSNYSVVLSDGTIVPVGIVPASASQSLVNSDVIFLSPSSNIATDASSQVVFTPITASYSFSLGQTVFSLAGTSTAILGQGLISDMAATSSLANGNPLPIITSIASDKTTAGSPLFDIRGDVIGVRTASLSTSEGASFEPIAPLMAVTPVLK
jgi:hypothetical protein